MSGSRLCACVPIADRLLIGARMPRYSKAAAAAADRKDASISDAIVAAYEQAPAAASDARGWLF